MKPTHRKFSGVRFSALLLGQVILFIFAFRTLLPEVFARQLAAGPLAIGVTFVLAVFVNCFFEWFFHRYFLHWAPIPFLRRLAEQHRLHHELTDIRLESKAGGTYILNEYPITKPEQYESSAFPWWSLIAFALVFTPPLLGLQQIFHDAPVLLSGYLSIPWSLGAYEHVHALEHRPYEWWKNRTEHPRFGTFWKRVYGFHEMHHFQVRYNESISGFFGLPIADWAFRTYYQPKELLLANRVATAQDFNPPQPLPFVMVLDQWARTLHNASRKVPPRRRRSSNNQPTSP